ncbi:toxin-antitoxin system YwqK family antitoxin [Pedobacter sp. NJ-S-72]
MKRILLCFFFLFAGVSTYAQIKTVFLDAKDQLTPDSTLAATYGVLGKVSGDSLYTFKKFDFEGILLASGSFRDDHMEIPVGKFVYYGWITPENNNRNDSFEINGRERFVELVGSYEDGRRNGRWITFYPDGKMKQIITFSQGIIHGPYLAFDIDGKQQVSGLYQSGKKEGTWTLNDGKQENEYVNDQLVSTLRGKKLREKQAERKKIN